MKVKGSISQAGLSLVLADGATGQVTITSAGSAARVLTLPDATDTLAGLTATQTFTNKTLTSPKINENVALTTTSTKLNYLTSATGTTGTASTNVVFSGSPTLVTPVLGVASATSVNKITLTAPATGATLTLIEGSTLATAGAYSTTLTATGATNVTLPTTGTLATRAGSETLTNKTLTAPIITKADLQVKDLGTALYGLTLVSSTGSMSADRTLVFDVQNVDRSVTLTGSLIFAGDFTTQGAFGITLVASALTTVTLPTSGTLATRAGSETLTNKILSGNTAVTLISGSGTLTLNTSGTVTLPNATDTLVGKATTDTLTNKTLTGNTAVNLISGSGTLTLNTSGTITLPNATDTVATLTGTETFTNKTLTSPKLNENVAVTTTATKLNYLTSAGGTTGTTSTNVVFSSSPTLVTPALGAATATSINGLAITSTTSGTLTLANSSSLVTSGAFAITLTSTATTGVTLPTTGTLSTLAGTETLTNKTLTSPKLNEDVAVTTTATKLNYLTSAAGTTGTASTNIVFSTSPTLTTPTIATAASLTEVATPANPSAGTLKLYAKTDDKLYTLNSGGTEIEVGSGASGGAINYITNGTIEIATTGWATYADAAGATPVDGTGGSPTFAIARNTSSPLRGTADLKLTKDAANRQGEGTSYAFTIPRQDVSKKLQISFDFDSNEDAAYASGDLAVYVYDVTNSALLTPVATAVPVGENTFTTSFDATSATSYRLIFHVATTNASAWDVYIDNVTVTPGVLAQGAVISSPVSWTPTGSWSANTTYTGTYQRFGNKMRASVKVAVSGAPTTATLTVNMPTGLTIDTSVLTNATASWGFLGESSVYDDSDAQGMQGRVVYSSTSAVKPVFFTLADSTRQDLSSVTQAAPQTFAASDYVSLDFEVPVLEWAGSGVMNVLQDDTLTEWQSWTPTGTWSTNTTYTGAWRRVGDTMRGWVKLALAGAPTSATLTVNLPTGYTVDTTKANADTDNGTLGRVAIKDSGTGEYQGAVYYSSTTVVKPESFSISGSRLDGTSITQAAPMTFASGDEIHFDFEVPILEWRGKSIGAVGFALATTTQAGLVNPYSTTSGVVYGGTYTPTLTNTTNIAASTPQVSQYMRVGSVVTVSGQVSIDPTSASTGSILKLTLPVTSTLASAIQLSGTAVGDTSGTVYQTGRVYGDAGASRAIIDFVSTADVANRTWHYQFTYLIV